MQSRCYISVEIYQNNYNWVAPMTIKNRIRAILTAFLLTTSMAVIAQGPIKPPELEWAPDQILIKLSEEARPGPPVHAGGPPSFSKAFDALAKKSRAGHAKTLFPHYNSAAIESLSKQPAQAQGRGPEMALKKGLWEPGCFWKLNLVRHH